MASVTKIAVTTSLFLLAQSEGRIHWEHRIGDYFDAPADKADIPLWRILTHSAGIRPSFIGAVKIWIDFHYNGTADYELCEDCKQKLIKWLGEKN